MLFGFSIEAVEKLVQSLEKIRALLKRGYADGYFFLLQKYGNRFELIRDTLNVFDDVMDFHDAILLRMPLFVEDAYAHIRELVVECFHLYEGIEIIVTLQRRYNPLCHFQRDEEAFPEKRVKVDVDLRRDALDEERMAFLVCDIIADAVRKPLTDVFNVLRIIERDLNLVIAEMVEMAHVVFREYALLINLDFFAKCC